MVVWSRFISKLNLVTDNPEYFLNKKMYTYLMMTITVFLELLSIIESSKELTSQYTFLIDFGDMIRFPILIDLSLWFFILSLSLINKDNDTSRIFQIIFTGFLPCNYNLPNESLMRPRLSFILMRLSL